MTPTLLQPLTPEVIDLVVSHRLTAQFDVAASTLLLWDIALTLGNEVELVWKSRWNFMKVLYLFQRYLPLIDSIGLTLVDRVGIDVKVAECNQLFTAVGWLMSLGFASSELILTLRTWAVWNRDRRLTILLPIMWFIIWGPVIGFQIMFLRSIQVDPPPWHGYSGCFWTRTNTALSFCFIMLMVWDTLVLSLMLVRGVKAYKHSPDSTLFDVVYRDGILYYLYIFTFSIFNVIAITAFPNGYQFLLVTFGRTIHSILSSRILLDLRLFIRQSSGWSEGLTDFIADDSDEVVHGLDDIEFSESQHLG